MKLNDFTQQFHSIVYLSVFKIGFSNFTLVPSTLWIVDNWEEICEGVGVEFGDAEFGIMAAAEAAYLSCCSG